ncbi:uncharacterized protein LOC120305063 [Crotalus tigris]|uniref:uncharacterized protein LOC120305063 n=1 Tax=Crotalus tigris TaxID=88082 RepID=UPI00192F4187|nr:uncharacterized protein LOC120305063 [Crotalus tigris]
MGSNSQHTYHRLEQTPRCTFILWHPSVDLCGFQHIAFTQPRMSWHQSLDPVPKMAQTAQRPIRSCRASRPVTCGDVKNLTAKPQAVLQQHQVEQTPENLCAAIFAVLTTNSLAIICFCLFVNSCPLAAAAAIPPKQALEQRIKQNLWVQLANITQNDVFCLSEAYDMENLLSTCLVPVCTPSAVIQNFTGLGGFLLNGNFNYGIISNWGFAAYYLPRCYCFAHPGSSNSCKCKVVDCTSSSKKTSLSSY